MVNKYNKTVRLISVIWGVFCLIGFTSAVYSAKPAPVVSITLPIDGSEIDIGEIIAVVVAFGPDETGKQNVKMIRLEIDGVLHDTYANPANIKEGTCQFTVDTGILGIGEHTLKATAIMAQEGTGHESSSTIRITVVQPTPDNILKKLENNYSKIQDISATITDTSQVGNNPSKTTIRDMVMKSPDKMKITSPDVTIITDGDKTTIKEPGQEPVTLSALDYTVETTPSQMDYFYHLKEFMEKHRVEVVSNEGKGVYILEAYPVTEEKLYSKLRIKVNTQDKVELYNEIYDEAGKLMYKKETLDYNTTGGVIIPTRYQETTYFETGNIVNTAKLEGIRLDTGVSDEEFK